MLAGAVSRPDIMSSAADMTLQDSSMRAIGRAYIPGQSRMPR